MKYEGLTATEVTHIIKQEGATYGPRATSGLRIMLLSIILTYLT